jgi:hypothetical protein
MDRIKITDNFYLDEFVHPKIYDVFKEKSRLYVSQKLIDLVQLIRENYGEPIYINTWGNGGKRINSGLRDYKNPLGKLNRSRHYYGLCADLTTNDIDALQKHIKENKELYFSHGLRIIEDFDYTKTWCHISVENSGLNYVRFIKP